jgi:hypothetical protein
LFLIAILVLRTSLSKAALRQWLTKLNWTSESKLDWQKFYDNAPRTVSYGGGGNIIQENIPGLPEYEDLKPPECKRGISNSAIGQNSFVFLTILSFVTAIMMIVL